MEKLRAGSGVGVRKGAWTKEEDILLTKCIHKFGEGRWHLVPVRAGLNRCRKSCRLRWLNYLNPNIKRGLFSKDEVDLIVRMHKLLGNRWSLIAGRIPGRTANDVKNFWNTHINKKNSSIISTSKSNFNMITESSIIRPQPRTIIPRSSKLNTSQQQQQQQQQQGVLVDPNDEKNNIQNMQLPLEVGNDQLVPAEEEEEEEEEVEECMRWWADLLEKSENENGARVPFSLPKDDGDGDSYQVNNPGDGINIDGGTGLSGFDIMHEEEEEDVWFDFI